MANPTRWKAGLLTSMVKIFFTPLAFYFCGLAYSQDDAFIRAVYENQGWAWVTGLREHRLFWYFILNVLTSFGAYVLIWLATALDIGCNSKKRYISMVFVPMVSATPLSAFVIGYYPACDILLPDYQCDHLGTGSSTLSVILLVGLFVANFMSVGVWLAMNEAPKISKETRLFWLPTYNGILIEQWLWLNRRTEKNDPNYISTFKQREECTIYICTTMYNESKEEMRQLLTSIKDVVNNRDKESPSFQSHIWLDGAFDTKRKKSKHLNANALRLLALMKSVFGVEFTSNHGRNIGFERHDTPYGLQLKWKFNHSQPNERAMNVVLHLKDNQEVKAKKRWSQIMYLSYIVDFLNNKPQNLSASTGGVKSNSNNWEKDLKKTFILATDADVKFTLNSVEALFDVFERDDKHSVSAVCGRTHPLGSKVQPIVSYQVFDYAIGHWLQKVANHVLGSVLCAPGCFSMYRTSVLKRAMAEYASDTKTGFEFLYKDMGEDRWLCTLLIKNQSGLEYCAVAEDKTFCPETFGEFFKQRRRWIVSTTANMLLLLKSTKYLVTSSGRITYPFMVYQFLILVSTLIGPSTVILVLSGGLEYAFGISDIAISIVLVVVAILFLIICMNTSNDTQINVAIGTSFIFALVMAAAFIGTIRQLVQEFSTFNLPAASNSSQTSVTELPVSSIYISAIAGIFIITALLHPTEITCLVHGITYLFFLPAGFLFLTIYSICNITDQSWGTREVQTYQQDKSALQKLWDRILGTCCPTRKFTPEVGNVEAITDLSDEVNYTPRQNQDGAKEVKGHGPCDVAKPVEEWLLASFPENDGIQACADNFKKLGYDDTTFIAEMSKEEIRQVGIINGDHVNLVHEKAQALPKFKIDPQVPTNTAEKEKWINSIGLATYRRQLLDHFDELPTTTETDQLGSKLEIEKQGHLKRLYKSIQQLRPPTPDPVNMEEGQDGATEVKGHGPCDEAILVKDWLFARFYQNEIKACADNFKKLGYDDTTFIAEMSKEEIRQVGIINRHHVNLVHAEVQKLPAFQIDPQVPKNTKEKENWIKSIGLLRYREKLLDHFDDLPTTTEKDQLTIKIGIYKPGHLKRLYKSIQQLRPPTPDEKRLMEVLGELKNCESSPPTPEVEREKLFWKKLIAERLKPGAVFKEKEDALKSELADLRKTALTWFAVANTLWLTVFLTLSNLGTDPEKPNLQLFGNNPLGLAFLFIFCFLLIVQFLAMLCHRLLTFIHLLARVTLGKGKSAGCCPELRCNISCAENCACCCQGCNICCG